jgi:glycerol-3-phosphate O-acyltransferase
MRKGTVVLLPTHFSNLDSILIGYTTDAIVGLPMFSYGAGLNLFNNGLIAYFFNRLGPYRIDRRKRNPIYLETLKSNSNLAIQRGVNSLFFPGGTRSRSGMLETKFKKGLLGTVIEAQRELCEKGSSNKVFVVPLVVSYHFVLEAPFLIEQHLRLTGKEKYMNKRSQGTSVREWIKFIWQAFSKQSQVALSFGKPMDVVGNFVDNEGISFDKQGNVVQIADYFKTDDRVTVDYQREVEYTNILSEKLIDRFQKENIVLSSHVVAFTAFKMLSHHNDKIDLYTLLRHPPEDYDFPIAQFTAAVAAVQKALFDLAAKGRLKLSDEIHLSAADLVNHGIQNLGVYHLLKPLTFNKAGDVESENFHTLYFYHNRLENFGLTKRVDWDLFFVEMR